MLAAETRAERVLLERIVDRRLGLEEILQGQRVRLHELEQRERLEGLQHVYQIPYLVSIR